MTPLMLVQQGALCAHLAAFAIAFSAVMREDFALLVHGRVDLPRLAATARTITLCLAALWLSGLALIGLQIGLHPQAFVLGAKLAAKLIVVSALTANGAALHLLAFPMLRRQPHLAIDALTLPVVLGAVSSASWLCASFIGASRLVAPAMSFADFIAVYAVLLAGAVAAALLYVRPRLARRLAGARRACP